MFCWLFPLAPVHCSHITWILILRVVMIPAENCSSEAVGVSTFLLNSPQKWSGSETQSWKIHDQLDNWYHVCKYSMELMAQWQLTCHYHHCLGRHPPHPHLRWQNHGQQTIAWQSLFLSPSSSTTSHPLANRLHVSTLFISSGKQEQTDLCSHLQFRISVGKDDLLWSVFWYLCTFMIWNGGSVCGNQF